MSKRYFRRNFYYLGFVEIDKAIGMQWWDVLGEARYRSLQSQVYPATKVLISADILRIPRYLDCFGSVLHPTHPHLTYKYPRTKRHRLRLIIQRKGGKVGQWTHRLTQMRL